MLTEGDHTRIAAAIDAVERRTSGDIFCIVTSEASNYREVPLAWAALVAILLPLIVLAVGGAHSLLIGSWYIAQATSQESELVRAISIYAAVQVAFFVLTALIVEFPPVRRMATPSFLKRHRTIGLARQHFVTAGMHLKPGQPHVLIFLALAERRVEILADEAVHKAVGERAWNEASAAVIAGMKTSDPTSGIVRAIEIAGAPLIEHFPATRAGQTQEGLAEI